MHSVTCTSCCPVQSSLIHPSPCVQAATAVDLLALSRADFQRLLGPLQDLLAANAAQYAPLVPSSKQVCLPLFNALRL